ncbi:unnamed protein product [Moneuplotes crassus]|uniref:Uncharacterized protein n=1 Tax=Euplotes crassus TaxID=5936 RepID=A0AAD1XAW2_EUPCR|nr:unnamed protein product [Moneuplotes crassus]
MGLKIEAIYPKDSSDATIQLRECHSQTSEQVFKALRMESKYCLNQRKRAFEEKKYDFKTFVNQSYQTTSEDHQEPVLEEPENDKEKENIDPSPVKKVRKYNISFKGTGALSNLGNILNQEHQEFVKKEAKKSDQKSSKKVFMAGKLKHKVMKEKLKEQQKKENKHYEHEDINKSIAAQGGRNGDKEKVTVNVLPERTFHSGKKRSFYIKVVGESGSEDSIVEIDSQEAKKSVAERKRNKKAKKKFTEKVDVNYDYYSDKDKISPEKIVIDSPAPPESAENKPETTDLTDQALSKIVMRDIMTEVTLAERYEAQQIAVRNLEKAKKSSGKSKKQADLPSKKADPAYKPSAGSQKNSSSDVSLIEEGDLEELKKEARNVLKKKKRVVVFNEKFVEDTEEDMSQEYCVEDDIKIKKGAKKKKPPVKKRKVPTRGRRGGGFLCSVRKIRN